MKPAYRLRKGSPLTLPACLAGLSCGFSPDAPISLTETRGVTMSSQGWPREATRPE